MTRYAIIAGEKITGVVNHDGHSEHPYGDVDLRGPVPDDATLEGLLGKTWDEVAARIPPAYVPPQTAEEAIAALREDGDADPEGTARLNHPHLFTPSPFDGDGDGRPGGSRPAEIVDPPMTAVRLIEAAEAKPPMPWFTFKAEAKRILGDDMPAKKPDIVEALRKLT